MGLGDEVRGQCCENSALQLPVCKRASVRTRCGRRVSLMTENCGGRSRIVAGLEAPLPLLAQPRSVQPSEMHTSSYSCTTGGIQ